MAKWVKSIGQKQHNEILKKIVDYIAQDSPFYVINFIEKGFARY